MPLQLQGNNLVTADVWGSGFRGLKAHAMPFELGSNGAYKKSLLSGTMAAGLAANSEIWQLRWTDGTRLGIVTEVTLDGLSGSATAFAAGFGKIDLMPARSWSAVGSGGTAGTLTGNNGKLRSSMGVTLLNDIRIASTAGLTAGTKTLDTDPIGQLSLSFGTVISVQYAGRTPLFLPRAADGEYPLVLATNEGLAMRATVPATGTWQFGVTCGYAEVDTF